MSEVQPGEFTPIPMHCFIRRPDDVLRCTLPPHVEGDHWHAYERVSWPRRPGEKQAD
ncbi:hypothetical protein [Streptomyces sp. NPDC088785]|uniref:hypothetical protein n=1 Tax=Streptomyces sp. NPDC088785 TaxID=3365897 RepID=UPI003821A663